MSKYFLSSKNLGQRFADYKGKAVRLALEAKPHTVDEVIVGIKGTNKTRKITTFRDSNGKIIERSFDFFDKPFRNRIYQHTDNVIGEDKFVTSTTIREFTLQKNKMKIYRQFQQTLKKLDIPTTLWEPKQILTNHLSENINTGERVLSQVKIENTEQAQKELHTFIEFPHIINNKKENKEIKLLSYRIDKEQDNVIKASITTQGVKAPQKDSFLRYRALSTEAMKEPITRKYIKERNLEKIGLKINTTYSPKANESQLIAKYTDWDGSINFNKKYKFKSKSKLIGTARHEVEHAWQYYLKALLTGGINTRTKEIAQKQGKIKSKALKKEAERCTKAINEYVPFNVDFKKYQNNYIEIKARKAGLKARNQYDRDGQEIRKSFPHIPQEML